MSNITHIFDGGSGCRMDPSAVLLARYLMANPNRIHSKDELCAAIDIPKGGRSIDTNIANIRRALGTIDCIATMNRRGYAWIGDSVELVQVLSHNISGRASKRQKHGRNPYMSDYAVMSQDEVAKRLGITPQAVGRLERSALDKLRKKPELMREWSAMLTRRGRHNYDPYYQCWLFNVQEDKGES